MPSLRYRDHDIAVFHIPDKSGESSCITCVEIRHKLDDSPAARVMLRGALRIAHEANEHGFAMGKRWIDDRLAKRETSAPSGRIAIEAGGGNLSAVRTKFKITSLVARLAYFVPRRFAGGERRL